MLKPECDNLEVNSASQIGEEHDNPSEDQASGLCECQDRLSDSPFLPADNRAYGPGPPSSPVYIPTLLSGNLATNRTIVARSRIHS